MPVAFTATVAEREAELVALQNAFDEYIASSRELEEELDAELAKMQEKLAESSAANAALSAQLENIGPQLSGLETALSESRQKLKEEQRLRRAAEQAQDEADQRLREMEQSIQHVREECDVVHEELAFKENELEESKLELAVEKEQLQSEVNKLRSQVQEYKRGGNQSSELSTISESDTSSELPTLDRAQGVAQSNSSVDEAYVKKLEEELELVTEQLIETERRLNESEITCKDLSQQAERLKKAGSRQADDDEIIETLRAENADRLEAEQRLREELELTKEELGLAKEEIQLQQEEIQTFENEIKNMNVRLDEEKAKHREELNSMNIELKKSEITTTNRLGKAAEAVSSIKQASDENERLREQIAGMEAALNNSRDDYQALLDELEAVNSRFDAAREEARQEGMESAQEELRAAMQSDVQAEVKEMREQISKLSEENTRLQQKIDDTKLELASVRDSGDHSAQKSNGRDSEVVKQLQEQLTRAKDEVAKKDREMSILTTKLEERVGQAEESVNKLESELRATKSQLAESEAHLIVLRREKERYEKGEHIGTSPRNAADSNGNRGRALKPSSSRDSLDRDELAAMDLAPSTSAVNAAAQGRSRSKSPTSVMKLELRLAEEVKKSTQLQKEYDDLQNQKRMSDVRIKRLEEDLKVVQRKLLEANPDSAVVTSMTRLSSLAASSGGGDVLFTDDGTERRVDTIIASKDFQLMCDELKSLEKQCNRQREYNSQLLSKILHLQGNIQVYCRVRPMTFAEMDKGEKGVVESLSETEVGCFDSRTNKWKSFAFDRVWGPDQTQQSIFQDVEPLALSVIDGFNACIFAYGQTGSGKTYTMEGVSNNNQYGISYRTIQKIFHLLNLRAQQQKAAEMFVGSENEDEPAKEVAFTFSLEVGMLEIYNDEVYDLLATEGASMKEKKEGAMRAGGKMSLEIKRNKDGRIEVPNLTKESVNSISEVMELLKRGNSNRATATTDMNEHSSRSHMVLTVDVYSGLDEAQRNKGTLYLVDLAGSERVRKSNVQGDQLKEAGFINRSLSALGNVMEALDRKASHVPYRDSKLTYLLQDSLGGNSRTMMVVTICPSDHSYDESVHALGFATRVRRIQIGAAQRNVTAKNLEETVKSLTDEMRALTRAKERTEGQLLSLKRDNARVQDKLQSLTKARTQNRADSKTLDVLKKNNDDMAKRWQKEKAAREEAFEDLDKAQKENRTLQQQLAKTKGKLQALEQKLEEKDHDLQSTTKQLRQQSNAKSAATLRARRDQVLNSNPNAATRPEKIVSSPPKDIAPSHSSTTGGAVAESPPKAKNDDVSDIRDQVLSLLEKYDKGKVNRIDIIMEKFKGKEALLLEKMTQRYEADSSASGGTSVQQRNQVALERHQERMRKIREKKQQNGAPGLP